MAVIQGYWEANGAAPYLGSAGGEVARNDLLSSRSRVQVGLGAHTTKSAAQTTCELAGKTRHL